MISSEDGFHFDNQKDKEVIIPPITIPEIGDRTHTRDPKIWRGRDAWYLVLGSTTEERFGEVLFYRSQGPAYLVLREQGLERTGVRMDVGVPGLF